MDDVDPGSVVGVVDLGGSHVAAAAAPPRGLPGAATRVPIDTEHPTTERTLDAMAAAMRSVGPVAGWMIAAPDPFDYDAGVCLIRGLAKLDELYGVDLRRELTDRLDPAARAPMRFLNDADAAGLGEWWLGAGGRADRCLFVSLGTGLGSAFVVRGELLATGPAVPRNGRLGAVAFDGVIADDRLSTRGLMARVTGGGDPRKVAARARAGEEEAATAYRGLGRDLARFLTPWIGSFGADVLVVGGGMSHSLDLLELDVDVEVRAAHRPDDAGLVGAAYAAGSPSS
ncbi:MAG: ROK family protein [Actinomycetota bacterium]